jgi:ATP-dependent Clp protease ATP-binding subunit ClpA
VVLLDEVEKAHSDVHEMFFQVFDKGYMDDAEGTYIDFKNTLILLTTNVGTDLITNLSEDEEMKPDSEALAQALRPELLKVFPPALLGRLVVLPYYPLSPTMLGGIVRLQLNRVKKRIQENHGIAFSFGDDVVDLIVSRCTEVASGGRMIDAILTNTMLPELSIELLNRQMNGEEVEGITVTADGATASPTSSIRPASNLPRRRRSRRWKLRSPTCRTRSKPRRKPNPRSTEAIRPTSLRRRSTRPSNRVTRRRLSGAALFFIGMDLRGPQSPA